MNPAVLSRQMQQGLADYLRTTFPVSNPFFCDEAGYTPIDRLLAQPGGVTKGPYISLAMPFLSDENADEPFPELPMGYTPYKHQSLAFARLRHPEPQPTLIATGTGSGKTECFLFPILDHCRRMAGRPGIKAVFLYPMNALGSDQANRLAGLIHKHLAGQVTAGLYVGGLEEGSKPATHMGADHLITDRHALRADPPDILLTNYKMLDYLLVRPEDSLLWAQNEPETLRYLVVDELHTFDGAQGTDLACLIRRLEARLATPPDWLCPVGTSATLGGDSGREDLLGYAEKVFGRVFAPEAVIGEQRLKAGEFLSELSFGYPPRGEDCHKLDPEPYQSEEEWLTATAGLWFPELKDFDPFNPEHRIQLGKSLMTHNFFHNLVKLMSRAPGIYTLEQIGRELARSLYGLNNRQRETAISSMFGLIAHARNAQNRPFLFLRYQLWARELARMVSPIEPQPTLVFSDDLTAEQLERHLPLVHCRECGAMGWTALKRAHENKLLRDLQDLYQGFFREDPKLVFLFPVGPNNPPPPQGDLLQRKICSECLTLQGQERTACAGCDSKALILVFTPDVKRKKETRSGASKTVSEKNCPYCSARAGLTLVGVRAAGMISTLITQNFGSPYVTEPKMLAFSDSVQDAAHRAGFFEARTWQFNLRIAVMKVLQQAQEPPGLNHFSQSFGDYWHEQRGQTWFLSTFIAPNMMWMRDFDSLTRTGSLPEGSNLERYVRKRLAMDLVHNMSLRARIGRSLEKSHCAILRVASQRLEQQLEPVWQLLANRCSSLRELQKDRLRSWLHGLVTHLKNMGAIYLPDLKVYLEDRGNTYRFNKIPWTPGMSPSTRRPVFLSEDSGSAFEFLGRRKKRAGWSLAWTEKVLFADIALQAAEDEAEQALSSALHALTAAGILNVFEKMDQHTWGLNPEALEIVVEVQGLACSHCRHHLDIAAVDLPAWQETPCFRGQCAGSYQPAEGQINYYGKLYRTGRVNRVFSREHTGLLQRGEREQLEDRFRSEGAERQPYYPNLISCTPTLEMGIDIGDLDTLALCSVPPNQAAYLQRIGRAGRRTGNALTASMAMASPHDLFFYAEPEEMMAGSVKTPGIFLDAAAVLERQLAAFCLDGWVAAGNAEIPRQVKTVFSRFDSKSNQHFPYNFMDYAKLNGTALLDGFLALFDRTEGASISPGTRETLRGFMLGGDRQGGLSYKVSNTFHERKKERDGLRKRLVGLRKRLKELEKTPARDEVVEKDIGEVQGELAGLGGLVRHLENQHTLNVLTDDGILPNYAFPEGGVILRSVIWRSKDKTEKGEKKFEHQVFQYERPAAGALAELAPENKFFAGGRRVVIDQVDLINSEVEPWRFCDRCSYNELNDTRQNRAHKECPVCRSTGWADEGQLRPMVKLRTVYAYTGDRESRIGDDSERRDNQFYRKKMLVTFQGDAAREAYAGEANGKPFGFEFLRKATFREVNFGLSSDLGEKVDIAGERHVRRGFRLCDKCGKVQRDNKPAVHAPDCAYRKPKAGKTDVLDCVYLYRHFDSEAIRILLPVTTFVENDLIVHSFVAALQLGLEQHFSGAIDHLRVTEHEEPTGSQGHRKRFLVLFDSIPGGTGYLKQLMSSPDILYAVMEKALAHLKACSCSLDADKDGCYRCLFRYRTSSRMRQTSRREAIALFSGLLEARDKLESIESLSAVNVNALFDSELEKRFIEALRRDPSLRLRPEVVNGKPGSFLQAGDQAWRIEPQVTLKEADGVLVWSKPDFVFRPVNNQERVKPIAVFLDGLEYHGDTLGDDLNKHQAIGDSGRFHVWRLAWDDVDYAFDGKRDYYTNYLDPATAPNDKFTLFRNGVGLDTDDEWDRLGCLDLFIRMLCKPDETRMRNTAWLYSCLYLQAKPIDGRALRKLDGLTGWQSSELALEGNWYGGYVRFGGSHAAPALELFALFEQNALGAHDAAGMGLMMKLDDSENSRSKREYKASWEGFLRLLNLFGYLPNQAFISSEAQRDGLAPGIDAWAGLSGAASGVISSPWVTLIDDYEDTDERDFLTKLAAADLPVPQPGFELYDERLGETTGQAELAWEDKKWAVLLEEDRVEAFAGAGWKTFFWETTDKGNEAAAKFLAAWERGA